MSVTDYLEHARECAAIADRKSGDEKRRLMDLAKAWLGLAEREAEAKTIAFGKVPEYPLGGGRFDSTPLRSRSR